MQFMTALIVLMGELQVGADVSQAVASGGAADGLGVDAADRVRGKSCAESAARSGKLEDVAGNGGSVCAGADFWRPLRLVFWLGWLLNAWLVAVLFYLAFFWHPFG